MIDEKQIEMLGKLRSYLMDRAIGMVDGDFRLAEDVVHDVILSLLKAKDPEREITNIKAYSFTVLKNTIAHRRAKSITTVGIENANLDHNLSFSYTMDANRQWSEMIDFEAVLEQLDEADADLIKMKYKSNMTNVAIAKELKMSEAGVRKRMVKTHENVKKIIMKMIDDNEQ